MISDDRERIAREDFLDDVNIRKHGAGDSRESSNASAAFREKAFADERANDAVGYGVHEAIAEKKVYTIAENYTTSRSGECLARTSPTMRAEILRRARAASAALRIPERWPRAGRRKFADRRAAREIRRDLGREADAAFDEVAIVLHAAGEKTGASCFDRAGKIFNARVINFQGDAAADGHFARVAEKRKAGDVGDGVNRIGFRLCADAFNFVQGFGGVAIQARHGRGGGSEPGLFGAALF